MKKVHELKIMPKYFDAVTSGEKTFEVRKKDRDFKVGDCVILSEFDGKEFTGRGCVREITYILDDPEYCKDGYVVFGMRDVR